MTDGTTGIQVAPITEDDMNKVRGILNRAADAIVGASQMAQDINSMRTELASLRVELDKLRNQNSALDEALYQARTTRQELENKLQAALADAEQSRQAANVHAADYDRVNDQLGRVQSELATVKSERDQWADEADKLSKERDTAHAKLDSIHVALGLTPQAMQAPTPTPPVDIVAGSDQSWRSDPSPSSVEPQAPATPVEPSTSTEWQPGYNWDATRQLYVRSTPF